MPFSDDFQTIHACDATSYAPAGASAWAGGRGATAGIAVSTGNGDYTAKQGSDCVEFAGSTANQINSIYTTFTTPIDMTGKHLWFWFFYAKGKGGAYLDPSDSLRVRLINDTTWSATPTNFVEFFLAGEIDIPSAWSLHCVSGDNDDADISGGTFNPASVKHIEIVVDQAAANSGGSDNAFAIDYFRIGTGITVTGTETNASLVTNYGIGTQHGVWEPLAALGEAVINKLCKITVGDDGTGASLLDLKSLVIYDNQKSDDAKFGWEVNGGGSGVATLRFGEKISGTGYSFGSSGCQLISSPKGAGFTRPDIAVNGNNGTLQVYGTLIKGYDTVALGDSNNPSVEIIDCEFDNCNVVEARTDNLDMKTTKIHDCQAATAALIVFNDPLGIDAVSIYNNVGDGMSVEGFTSLDNITEIGLIANDDGLILDQNGPYNLTEFNFSANTTDIFWDGPTTGTLTVNLLNGSNASTSRANGTATVDLLLSNTFTITGALAGGLLTIFDDNEADFQDLGTILRPSVTTTTADEVYGHGFSNNPVIVQYIVDGYEEINVEVTLQALSQSLDLSTLLTIEENI